MSVNRPNLDWIQNEITTGMTDENPVEYEGR
jgi:hypothetical protein